MINKNAGKKWPWIIAISTVIVIGFAVKTVSVAVNNPVEMSEYGMQGYHEYDRNVNDIINAKIEFDKKYTITFLTPQIMQKGSVLEYAVKDKSGEMIEDANVSIVLTRPDTTKLDIFLDKPSVKNGVYTFNATDLPQAGRWDIMAKVTVGKDQRYYNLKADTRSPDILEF